MLTNEWGCPASHPPSIRHVLTPDRTLLFRFSALTFNAHAIHLNPDHCRNVEGLPNLLVHGPLTLTLLLTMVEGGIVKQVTGTDGSPMRVRSITYRNIAPLFVDEPMTLCARMKSSNDVLPGYSSFDLRGDVWEVWIEGPDQGVRVRGQVVLTKS